MNDCWDVDDDDDDETADDVMELSVFIHSMTIM